MAIVDAGARLALKSSHWHVRAAFEFTERDGTGAAALVEGATLVLFHADAHIEALLLDDLDGLETRSDRPASIVVHHAGRRLVLRGNARGVNALHQAAGTRHRRAPAGAWLWAEPEGA